MKTQRYPATFTLPVTNIAALPDDGAEYEVTVEGSVQCNPTEYMDGWVLWPACNEIYDEFVVIEVLRDGEVVEDFNPEFWNALIDEKELDVCVSEFEPEYA